jgi:serine/threonine protein kinase
MAPEVMRMQQITPCVDVYSMGIIIWELTTRECPFSHHSDYHTFVESVCFKDERPELPSGVPENLLELMECCWDRNPILRPTMHELVAMLDNVITEAFTQEFEDHVDSIVLDARGRMFWKLNFPRKVTHLQHSEKTGEVQNI